jgi:hypothetical protein
MSDRPEDRPTDSPDFPNDSRTFQSGFEPGDLDFGKGDALWGQMEALCASGGPGEHLDAAMDGKAAPRTWLIVHPPGQGELSAAMALAFARELASRDQSPLVLDADETDSALTGWIGRDEAEGWIDLARYGTSVLTSGVNLPFEGRRGYVLGVGSFTPTDVTGEEIGALMARLRRQADDVLVVAPADELGLAWAGAADARLFCWDPERTSQAQAGEMAGIFAEAGHPMTWTVAFGEIPASGLAASEERLVEEVLAESAEPEEETPDHEGFDDGPVGEVPRIDSEDNSESDSESDQESKDDTWGDPPLGPGVYGEGEEPKQSTSKVFWFGAVAAVLVIAVAVVYYFKVLKVPSDGHFENRPVATQTQPAPQETTPGETASETDMATGQMDSLGGLAESGATEATSDTVAQGADDTMAAVEPEPVVEAVVDQPVDAQPTVVETTPDQVDGFDMAPYLTAVGEKGWALHVYSLPSMESLQIELKELERRNLKTAVKAVDVPEKGRWYRVYLGNFATRAEANAAKPALLEKLGADYAAAKRFESSSPE